MKMTEQTGVFVIYHKEKCEAILPCAKCAVYM
jgi:hypothetical protein